LSMGPEAVKLSALAPAERQRTFLDALVTRFGTRATTPFHYGELDWGAEEWTRGAMFAHYAPGVLTGFGRALREPCGRIHWAGTETATLWSGSIEGAVRSGERAADEVMAVS
jgi:monoamine oxidase